MANRSRKHVRRALRRCGKAALACASRCTNARGNYRDDRQACSARAAASPALEHGACSQRATTVFGPMRNTLRRRVVF